MVSIVLSFVLIFSICLCQRLQPEKFGFEILKLRVCEFFKVVGFKWSQSSFSFVLIFSICLSQRLQPEEICFEILQLRVCELFKVIGLKWS